MTKINPADYRVMVVDDDPTTLLTVSSILQAEGYEVVELSDALEASERVGTDAFDILLCDYKMPGVDGLSLVRRARLLKPNSMRMMLTGVGDYEVAVAAINQGEVYRFMTKPIDEVELRLNTRLACEHLRLVRELERLRREMRQRDALLERLERENPGITQVDRRNDGSIRVGETENGA